LEQDLRALRPAPLSRPNRGLLFAILGTLGLLSYVLMGLD
jgi:hypothetical protein